jgi:lipoprotein-anchoring transpeptidase ErfK/SrfK
MQRLVLPAIIAAFTFTTATAGPLNLSPPNSPPSIRPSAGGAAPLGNVETPPIRLAQGPSFGGGFLELLFRGPRNNDAPRYEPFQRQYDPAERQYGQPGEQTVHPRYLRQVVDYDGRERGGTIIINTNERFLYLIQDNGTAIRYGIGVGRPGFTWAGVRHITRKREWPDWTPPPEMLRRRPDLPRHMEGGPENPLGARAMYLGSTLYRIHGSNEPWTIGTAVSSGCIRMRNEDVIDLYQRVKVGTKVVVI